MENITNFDFNQCIKEINNIGSTTYQNICNGEVATVVWGTGDWIENFLTYAIYSGIVGLFLIGLYSWIWLHRHRSI